MYLEEITDYWFDAEISLAFHLANSGEPEVLIRAFSP